MSWPAKSERGLPSNWSQLVAEARARAGGRCQWAYRNGGRCRKPGTDADHYGDRDDHEKLRWLCSEHHAWRTSRQGNEAKAVIREKRRRPAEPHPGMIRR